MNKVRARQRTREEFTERRRRLLYVLRRKALNDVLLPYVMERAYYKTRCYGIDGQRADNGVQNAFLYMREHFEAYLAPPQPQLYMEDVIHWRLMDVVMGRVDSTDRHMVIGDEGLFDNLAQVWDGCREKDPTDRLAAQELLRMINSALTGRERDIVKARFIDGLTSEETTQQLGITAAAVRQTFYRLAPRMRQLFANLDGDQYGEPCT